MKFLSIPLTASLLILGAGPALAQAPATAAPDNHSSHHPAASAQQTPLSEGEITRWDPRTLRLTLKHGEIKNLDMPPMTMVFQVQNPALLQQVKAGDKVRFTADKVGGNYTVISLERAEGAGAPPAAPAAAGAPADSAAPASAHGPGHKH